MKLIVGSVIMVMNMKKPMPNDYTKEKKILKIWSIK